MSRLAQEMFSKKRFRHRCSKCWHRLPPGRKSWVPRWAQWAEADGLRWTFAGDGPALGYLIKTKSDEGTEIWHAYVLTGTPPAGPGKWPASEPITSYVTRYRAMRAVEREVHDRRLWP